MSLNYFFLGCFTGFGAEAGLPATDNLLHPQTCHLLPVFHHTF
jgi:hypothetical protein